VEGMFRFLKKKELQAESDVAIAKSPMMPKVDAFAFQTWQRYRPEAIFEPFGSSLISDRNFITYGFEAEQTIYDFGKNISNLRASKYGLMAKKIDTERIKNLLSLEFIIAYFGLLEADKILMVAEKEVEQVHAHLKDTQALYEEEIIALNDLLDAEVNLADARQKLLSARNLRNIEASKINKLLMRSLDDVVRAEEVITSPIKEVELHLAWEIAVKERPEVRALKNTIKAEEEGLKAIRAEYFPEVFVTGGYEFQENRFMVHEENWSLIGVALTLIYIQAGKRGQRLVR